MYNADTYDPDAFSMDGFHGSLVEYMVRETEKLNAKVWNSAFAMIKSNEKHYKKSDLVKVLSLELIIYIYIYIYIYIS